MLSRQKFSLTLRYSGHSLRLTTLTRRSINGLLAAFLVSLCLAAQDRPTPSASGATILRRSLALAGVPAASLHTFAASGTLTQTGVETDITLPFRVKAIGSDRVRWEFDYPEGTATSVARKGGGWRSSARGGGRLSLGQIPGRSLEYFPSVALAMWLSAPAARAELIGTELIDGTFQHKIELRRPYPGEAPLDFANAYEQVTRCELYLEAETLRIVRLRYFDHSRDWRRGIPIDLYFSNYQLVGGILVPLTVTRKIGTQRASQIQITSIEVNAPVSESDFVEVKR